MEWRKIPGFGRYSVSESGNVRRDGCAHCMTKERPVKATMKADGYFHLSITADSGRSLTRTVHTLVAYAFLGPRPDGLIICHGDGDRTNNYRKNLRYDTYASNTEDARRHGTLRCGTNFPRAKLKEEDIPKIKDLLAARKLTQTAIGELFGVTQRVIWQIAAGRTWRHVTNGESMDRYTRRNRPQASQ